MKRAAIKTIETLVVMLILAIGCYPVVSDAWNRRLSDKMIVQYQESMWQRVSEGDIGLLREAAERWNQRRQRNGDGIGALVSELSAAERKEYEALLDSDGSGVMGYLEIPKISVSLPIYHGTSDEVLAKGVGHLEGSSLPIGGESTHGILSGHRGLPSARLFTDLDQLEEGDSFTINILDQTLQYQVTEIQTVLPEETENLRIQQGKDLITLVTCTPYGVNTHRLLITGERVEQDSGNKELRTVVPDHLGRDSIETGNADTNPVETGSKYAAAEKDKGSVDLKMAPASAGNLQEELQQIFHRPEWILLGALAVLICGILRMVWLWTIDLERFRRRGRIQKRRKAQDEKGGRTHCSRATDSGFDADRERALTAGSQNRTDSGFLYLRQRQDRN